MKKGFTLVELLCVIVIIAVISLITFPKVTSYINQTKESLYKTQVKDLEKTGEKWALDNIDYLDKYHINDTIITLDLLKAFEYLEKDEILNPKDKKPMEGCILISYKDNKYNYKYIDPDDPDTKDVKEKCVTNKTTETATIEKWASPYFTTYSDSYVVYDNFENDVNGVTTNTIVEAVNSKKNTPFYQKVLENNILKAVGEKESGLYDIDDEYVFRGNRNSEGNNLINNYVKYEGNEWRILSINKHDYSMKLISTGAIPESNIDDPDIKTEITDTVSNYSKIIDKWDNGIVDDINVNVNSLDSLIKQESITSRIGLISLYDYAMASLDDNCYNNISSGACVNNNYVATMFSGKDFWTMTQNSEGKYWYVSSANAITAIESTSGPYYYAKVIKVPINVYCTNCDTATGSGTNFAYELK